MHIEIKHMKIIRLCNKKDLNGGKTGKESEGSPTTSPSNIVGDPSAVQLSPDLDIPTRNPRILKMRLERKKKREGNI